MPEFPESLVLDSKLRVSQPKTCLRLSLVIHGQTSLGLGLEFQLFASLKLGIRPFWGPFKYGNQRLGLKIPDSSQSRTQSRFTRLNQTRSWNRFNKPKGLRFGIEPRKSGLGKLCVIWYYRGDSLFANGCRYFLKIVFMEKQSPSHRIKTITI